MGPIQPSLLDFHKIVLHSINVDNTQLLKVTFANFGRMMENIKTMRLFLQVVQAGSLSAGSRQSGFLRQRIPADDRFRGRSGRQVAASDHQKALPHRGRKVYLERAERLLQDLDDLRDTVNQLAVRPRGNLCIQSRTSLGSQHVAPLIPQFLEHTSTSKLICGLPISTWICPSMVSIWPFAQAMPQTPPTSHHLASSPRVVCASPKYWHSWSTNHTGSTNGS